MQLWSKVIQWPWGKKEILEMHVEIGRKMHLLGECGRLPRGGKSPLELFGPKFEVSA